MFQAQDITIKDLRKSFGPNEVLHGIDLTIRGGEFIGLMGPNGAGKSTLIKILDGVYTASDGEIRLGGEVVENLGSHRNVEFIHQDLGLIDSLSISDNLRLTEPPLRAVGPLLNRRAERKASQKALELVDLDHSPGTFVSDLAPGEKTLLAVARAFQIGADIVFVDEATSTLPSGDATRVISILKRLAAEGATVIMVTHKLGEVLSAAQRVVLLIDGDVAADEPISELSHDKLVAMLVEHETGKADSEKVGIDAAQPTDLTRIHDQGEVLLTLQGAYGGRAGPIDLTVHAGEVVGITGLPGSGLHDVAYLAYGAMKPSAGEVVLSDKSLVRALLPPHRESQGGFPLLSVKENMSVSALRKWVSKIRILRPRSEGDAVEREVEELNVQPPDSSAAYGNLSGGNKQKAIFGRLLLQEPDIYVLSEPTRGIDVATRQEIYSLIGKLRAQGAGVLIVTSDAEDLFAVCDRIGVIDAGRADQLIEVSELDKEKLEAVV